MKKERGSGKKVVVLERGELSARATQALQKASGEEGKALKRASYGAAAGIQVGRLMVGQV